MDLDLQILNEESDCPNPLFNSIMNAMNSMKEATADKIYQKIQREGETNYSKPQVDRALAKALKYGIFEVKNNRYRVRDDVLDDEDTVYWKLQKKREPTPFRIQEDINERHYGPKLDPERDNQRFKRMTDPEKLECPQCGRTKKIFTKTPRRRSRRSVRRKGKGKKRRRSSFRRTKYHKNYDLAKENSVPTIDSLPKLDGKRKLRPDSNSADRNIKIRRVSGIKTDGNKIDSKHQFMEDNLDNNKEDKKIFKEEMMRDDILNNDSTDESDCGSLSSPSDDERSVSSYRLNEKLRNKRSRFAAETDDVDRPPGINLQRRSSLSFRSDSDTDKSERSYESDSSPTQDGFLENLPCSSRNVGAKGTAGRTQYLDSAELYSNKYGRGEVDQCDRKSDWMGYSGEPQGAIIETNNVLTIEPMDSLAFKSPEQASYIS